MFRAIAMLWQQPKKAIQRQWIIVHKSNLNSRHRQCHNRGLSYASVTHCAATEWTCTEMFNWYKNCVLWRSHWKWWMYQSFTCPPESSTHKTQSDGVRKSSVQSHHPTGQTKANQKSGSPTKSSFKVNTLVGANPTGSTKKQDIVVHEGAPGARTGSGRLTSEDHVTCAERP